MTRKIVRDTREKHGWDFSLAGYEMVDQKLDAGDYCLDGSKSLIIERKATTGEIYLNLSATDMKNRFYREMVKLQEYSSAFVVCEFPERFLYEFPKNSSVPESKWPSLKMSSKYLRRLIYDIQDNYPPVKFVYCENREAAQQYVLDLLFYYGEDDGETY